MVKNTCGGNKHKGQARKVVMAGKQANNKLRIMEEEGEIYAQVAKIFGGPLCSVLCLDNVTRNCIIRGKFRNKRDCIIKPGSFILVGLRQDMSVKTGVVETCDLLEVYTDSDKEKLKTKQPHLSWRVFVSAIDNKSSSNQVDDDLFEFSEDVDNEFEELMKQEFTATNETKTKTTVIDFGEDNEVNVDDI